MASATRFADLICWQLSEELKELVFEFTGREPVNDGFKRSHFDAAERDALLKLNQRALNATRRYLRYLRSCKEAPAGRPYEPRSRNDRNPNDRNEERQER